MVSRAGSVLLEPQAIEAYRRELFPLAELITPNLQEARLLTGLPIAAPVDLERAAGALLEHGPQAVLIKGGGLVELRGQDYLLTASGPGLWLRHDAITTANTHGSGCTLAAAITALRARGLPLLEAVQGAKTVVTHGLRHALDIGTGQGPLWHWHMLLGP
jgi:hydroxymethylpyrimidine/phosphomethylpyrimidine kinase